MCLVQSLCGVLRLEEKRENRAILYWNEKQMAYSCHLLFNAYNPNLINIKKRNNDMGDVVS